MEPNYAGFEQYLTNKCNIHGRVKYEFAFDNGYAIVVLALHKLYGRDLYEIAVSAKDEFGSYKLARIPGTVFADGSLVVRGENIAKYLRVVNNIEYI